MTPSPRTAQVVAKIAPGARDRLKPRFDFAGVPYPPPRLVLLALKAERRLEVWAERGSVWLPVRDYPIRAASGKAGPKLREGDRQVPEGIYRIVRFNPDSRFHLSLRLDYPNAFDLSHAKADGRHEPGGDIYIHGGSSSVGCLAMGDPVIEELFTLVYDTGAEQVEVLILPSDPRRGALTPPEDAPPWTAELYRRLDERAAVLLGR